MIVRTGITLEDGTRLEPGDSYPGTPAKWLVDQGIVEAVNATATDAARKLADELGLDITEVDGTGKDGKVTKDDVEAAAEAETGGD